MPESKPLFPPGSAIRRIGGESVLLVAGGRALLLQAAHPLVAAGIAAHSGYRGDPWRRLARTMQAVYGIVFGTAADAERIGAAVRRAHGRVRGELAEDVGPYRAGTPYMADDPALLLWVHATLVDSAVVAYERFVGPLDATTREAFHAEMCTVARLFGTPDEVLHPSWSAFRAYWDAMLADGLHVGADARLVAETVLDPPAPLLVRPPVRIAARLTTTLLPEPVLAAYGLRARRPERALVTTTAAVARRTLPLVPDRLRLVGGDAQRTLPGLVLRALVGDGRRVAA